jgi:hypothetical protein
MKPNWIEKRDPEQHPVRFLAGVWQQRLKENFGLEGVHLTPKEMGQLKSLRKSLGDLTINVVEWMLDPVHWWHFCQQIKSESKDHPITDYPDVGLVLLRRGSLLRAIRSQPQDTSSEFLKRIDKREYKQIKELLLVAFAEGKPERLAKIEAATTLTDMKKLFNEMADEIKAESHGQFPFKDSG